MCMVSVTWNEAKLSMLWNGFRGGFCMFIQWWLFYVVLVVLQDSYLALASHSLPHSGKPQRIQPNGFQTTEGLH